MADDTISDKLREMAEHRGLKLIKSRKRKAGTGDYGKFGLTDLDGKPLLGISDEGLTASPKEIEDYLRQGATSTWKASADSTPERSAPIGKEASPDGDDEPAIRPRRKQKAEKERNRDSASADTEDVRPDLRKVKPLKSSTISNSAVPRKRGMISPKADPAPEPELVIRAAKAADAAALVPLLSQLVRIEIDELAIARNLDVVRKAKGGMVVAELRELIGFCSWAVLFTVQHGAIGRISLLLVDENHRRKGIATALLKAAMASLRKAGCARLEAMSDIEIANSHGFFRTLKFEQTSYCFARDIDVPE